MSKREETIKVDEGKISSEMNKKLPTVPARNEMGENRSAHILFIVENNTVPLDIRVWREARTAREAGYTVSVIAPKNKRYSKSYEIREGIEIYRHYSYEGQGGRFDQVVEYANALFWEFIFCAHIFLTNRFEIIHGANPPDHIFILAMVFKLFGVKYIFDHHDLSPELYASKFNGRKKSIFKILRLMEKLSCRISNAIISTNESYKSHIIEIHRVNPEKVCVVRNDPEINITSKQSKHDRPHSGKATKLIYVGTINFQDGLDILIRVVHVLVKELGQKQIVCTVVGDGNSLKCVKQLCNDLDMTDYFDFKGYVYDRETVQKYINEADICLDTAPKNEINQKSTFIKIMEYMISGKAIVAFDLDETRFTTDSSAVLVEPGDIVAYAKEIDRLIKDPIVRNELGEKAKRRIIESLNWNNSSKKLMSLYKSMLSTRI